MSTNGQIQDRDAALAYLYDRIDYERSARLPYRSRGLKLDRMRELLSYLGNPQQAIPVVHVAGTKGKGSTSAMIAAILSVAGYRTGLYTSPHLHRIEERLVVDGKPCSSQEFTQLVEQIRPFVEKMDADGAQNGRAGRGPTYFEITTAAALAHFARREVDAAVLEVGLGGRLDSTNVCSPEVCVITSISLDHTRQLGNTLASIAAEKAGIIKPAIPVITGVTNDEPLGIIEQIARQRGADCYVPGRDFHLRYHGSRWTLASDEPGLASGGASNAFDYWETNGQQRQFALERVAVGLLGRHQASNAAVAIAAIRRLCERGWKIEPSHIRTGLATVQVAARAERLSNAPSVVIDAAHNVASIEALVETLCETGLGEHSDRRILVFATSEDKDAEGMLRRLLPHFDMVILTRYMNNPRFVEPADLLRMTQRIRSDSDERSLEMRIQPNPSAAWQLAKSAAKATDLICVTGSFFLASEIRELVLSAEHRPTCV
jgi:dihydrofolate synthase/folylpolyglutamate synthase